MLGRPKNLEINILLKDAERCARIKKRFGYAASNYEVAAMHYKEILFHEKAASCLTMAFFYYQIEKKNAKDSGRSDDAKFSDERANGILDLLIGSRNYLRYVRESDISDEAKLVVMRAVSTIKSRRN